MFAGLSSLRASEKAAEAKAETEAQRKMREYLAKYESGGGTEEKKKKKRKKKPVHQGTGGIQLVDEDVSGFAPPTERPGPSQLEAEDEDYAPVVVNPEGAERARRLIEKEKEYFKRGEDGSGWAVVGGSSEARKLRGEIGSDMSPPRRQGQRHHSPDMSPPRRQGQRHDSPDMSPPRRKGQRHDSPDMDPPRRRGQRHGSPDMSPPRRKGQRHDSPDMSPPRRQGQRHGSPDMSPPRRKGQRHDSPDMSPPRQQGQRHGSPDMSPPRRKGQRHESPDMSPPRRKEQRHESPGMSPPRRRGQRHDSPDMSPPRRKGQRHDSPDISPPRRQEQRHDSPDMSPPRRQGQRHDSPDMSPPRRKGQRHDSPDMSRPEKRHSNPEGDMSPPRRDHPRQANPAGTASKPPQLMSDGTVAGMISGRDLKVELDTKKRNDMKRFKEMDSKVSGRNAETVYRDRSGKKYASRAEYEAAIAEEKAKKQAKHVTEVELEWGGGMKQKQRKAEMRKAMQAEAARPFARGRDDVDLNALQRDALRWGDPMAHLVAKRKRTALEEAAPSLMNSSNRKEMKKSGFIIPQEIPSHSWIRRGVGAPANRYSIKPGRHWDGVDRSNGFETKMWKEQQRRAAQETEAFMWAQSDM